MDSVLGYIESHKTSFLDALKQVLRFESVSADPSKKEILLACARAETEKFKQIGLENVALKETKGYPVIYGDWLHAKGAPTVLVYGHYDVQPADPLDLWETPPFEPTERNGNLYGRGTADNKGQHYIYLCAIESFLKTVGKLPINIKVILEGEEESGSLGSVAFLKENAKLLACDAVLVSDTSWYNNECPSICYSLRGIASFEIVVKGPGHDLHSGMYGGFAPNPLTILSQIVGRLKDDKGHILVPGFYDDVLPIDQEEKRELQKLPWSDVEMAQKIGAKGLLKEDGFTALESNWFRPALDVNGLWGGYQGAGSKTVIPTVGGAKVSMRFVANQNPEKIMTALKKYVASLAPASCEVEVKVFGADRAFYTDPKNAFVRKAQEAFGKAYGKPFALVREGASIPILATMQDLLKAPIVLAGIGLPDDRIHSPNEKLSLRNFYDGIKAAALTFEAYSVSTFSGYGSAR